MAFTSPQMEELQKLGTRIREIREGKGLSQQQLGDLIDKERQAISRIELGQINPSYLQLMQIATGLSTTVSALTKGL